MEITSQNISVVMMQQRIPLANRVANPKTVSKIVLIGATGHRVTVAGRADGVNASVISTITQPTVITRKGTQVIRVST